MTPSSRPNVRELGCWRRTGLARGCGWPPGAPSYDPPNILTLEQWSPDTPIETILADPENRYHFLQDRRDEGIYWLQAKAVGGGFRRTFVVGGPGKGTDHEREPLMLPHIEAAYVAAIKARWD